MKLSLKGKEYIELCDLLKVTNLAPSGGAAKHIISEGEVQVDGQVELRKRCKIKKDQKVLFKGNLIEVID